MARTACTEPQCLYSRAIPLLPLWSVRSVQSLSRAIPLLPLWAVRPAQSLSACTVELYLYSHYGPYGLHRASVELYLYSPYGPYGLYRASEPVQGCTVIQQQCQRLRHHGTIHPRVTLSWMRVSRKPQSMIMPSIISAKQRHRTA
jgi:hypothetical protein